MNPSSTTGSPSVPSTLVGQMAAGDHRALASLYDAYGHVAYALAFAITGTQTVAESVVSQAFAEAWRSASSFEAARSSVLAWLTAIVRRVALRAAPAGTIPSARRSDAGGESRQVLATTVSSVGDAIRSLSSRQRRVVELSYYRGLTVGEIAAQLGEPESGARELLRSAMQELRSALGPGAGATFDERVITRA